VEPEGGRSMSDTGKDCAEEKEDRAIWIHMTNACRVRGNAWYIGHSMCLVAI